MPFPSLIEEDIQRLDAVMGDFLATSEARTVLLVEKAGHLIRHCGEQSEIPLDALATLASNSFNAVQYMAGLLDEKDFPGIYQQGDRTSTLILNVDENCLLVVIFPTLVSVGAVRYYAVPATQAIATQLQAAGRRNPTFKLDLTDLNVADASAIFRRKEPVPDEGRKES